MPSLLGGHDPVSSSNIPITGPAPDGTDYSANPPKAMTVEEIQDLIREYDAAAKRAMDAGFDGVEIHA